MVYILVAGQPGVHVPRLQVAGDDAYEFAVGEQVPDDAAVLENGLDAARPHWLVHGRRDRDAGRPFGEIHFDVRAAGQPEVRCVVHHDRGLVVGREQLVHETHDGVCTSAA